MLSNYKTIKTIGEGSFGRVFLVSGKGNGDGEERVMKKVFIGDLSSEKKEQATNEVYFLARLKHPNIIEYFESFFEGEHLYIVMSYAEGGDLYSHVRKRKERREQGEIKTGSEVKHKEEYFFGETLVLDWFMQIVLGLKYIHDLNIIHRDLKTQNVFLTKNNVVKIGDFGIAKSLSTDSAYAQTVVGTPYNMSPELCEDKPYNRKSDIWALGCLLYELCTLEHPFEGQCLPAIVLKIVRGKYKAIPPLYSSQMSEVIDSMLNLEPEDRPDADGLIAMDVVKERIVKFVLERNVPGDSAKSSGAVQRSSLGKTMSLSKIPDVPSPVSSTNRIRTPVDAHLLGGKLSEKKSVQGPARVNSTSEKAGKHPSKVANGKNDIEESKRLAMEKNQKLREERMEREEYYRQIALKEKQKRKEVKERFAEERRQRQQAQKEHEKQFLKGIKNIKPKIDKKKLLEMHSQSTFSLSGDKYNQNSYDNTGPREGLSTKDFLNNRRNEMKKRRSSLSSADDGVKVEFFLEDHMEKYFNGRSSSNNGSGNTDSTLKDDNDIDVTDLMANMVTILESNKNRQSGNMDPKVNVQKVKKLEEKISDLRKSSIALLGQNAFVEVYKYLSSLGNFSESAEHLEKMGTKNMNEIYEAGNIDKDIQDLMKGNEDHWKEAARKVSHLLNCEAMIAQLGRE
eukprot:Nk52_evm22s248 gene=Nk52_evmTU22s248